MEKQLREQANFVVLCDLSKRGLLSSWAYYFDWVNEPSKVEILITDYIKKHRTYQLFH